VAQKVDESKLYLEMLEAMNSREPLGEQGQRLLELMCDHPALARRAKWELWQNRVDELSEFKREHARQRKTPR
jgi:hypothetical protein